MIRCAAAFALALLLGDSSPAQEKREPPPHSVEIQPDTTLRTSAAKLPSIDLPEYVITGKEVIDLPQASKRSPEPQAREVLLDRGDLLGGRESAAALAAGVSHPPPMMSVAKIFDGKVSAGYGSYRTPFFDGWFGQTFGVAGFLLKAGYVSSAGHLSHADYRKGYSELSGTTTLPDEAGPFAGARVKGTFGMDGHSYRLYGSTNPSLQRTVGRMTLAFSIHDTPSDLIDYGAKFSVQTASQKDNTSARETCIGLELNGNRTLGTVELQGDAAFWIDSYSAPVALQNPNLLMIGLSARRQFSEIWDIFGGIVAFSYRGTDAGAVTKIYPRIRASLHATPSVTFFASVQPGVTRSGLSSMIQENPYLVNTLQIRHLDRSVDITLGTEANIGQAVRTRVAVGVERLRNLPLYVDQGSAGIWAVDYAGATDIVSFEGEVYADFGERDNAAGSIIARTARNSFTNAAVPYLPALEISGLYQHSFPAGITLEVIMKVAGHHYVDVQGTRGLGPSTIVDLRGNYAFAKSLTATVAVNNIFNSNQTWWDRYEGVGRTASFMIGFAW